MKNSEIVRVNGQKRGGPEEFDGAPNYSTAVPPVATTAASSDYPTPKSLVDKEEFVWDEDENAVDNYCALGKRLAATGDLFRRPEHAAGLIVASDQANIEPIV